MNNTKKLNNLVISASGEQYLSAPLLLPMPAEHRSRWSNIASLSLDFVSFIEHLSDLLDRIDTQTLTSLSLHRCNGANALITGFATSLSRGNPPRRICTYRMMPETATIARKSSPLLKCCYARSSAWSHSGSTYLSMGW